MLIDLQEHFSLLCRTVPSCNFSNGENADLFYLA